MVILRLSFLAHIPQTNGSFTGLSSVRQKNSSKFHCNLPPRLFISNSQQSHCPISLFHSPDQNVAAIIFGDGPESRLHPLTKRRSEGAIPIAANYRLVDAVVSNCINSNINKIYALTQCNSTSLNSHLSRAYSGFGLGRDGFVEVIAAFQSLEDKGWFQGDADAIRRCLRFMEEYPVSEFLILPGHHLYRMDYQKIIEAHRKNGAAITIAALNASRDQDTGYGFLNVNTEHQVLEFRLKSESAPVSYVSEESARKCNDIAYCKLSSMGIYLINRDMIIQLLRKHFPRVNDFTSEVIPGAMSMGMKLQAFIFDGYWEDMKTIKAFYQANMESTKKANMGFKSVTLMPGKAASTMPVNVLQIWATLQLTQTSSFCSSFFDLESPIYTLPRILPPTHMTDAVITDSVIGEGCIVGRCRIKGSVVGTRTTIGDGAVIEDSVIMGSDIYQMEGIERNCTDRNEVEVPIGIGEDTQIKKAIVDKSARIGKNVLIINRDNVQERNNEANGYVINGGIVVVLPGAVIPNGSIL